jgi:hypothetical protein
MDEPLLAEWDDLLRSWHGSGFLLQAARGRVPLGMAASERLPWIMPNVGTFGPLIALFLMEA